MSCSRPGAAEPERQPVRARCSPDPREGRDVRASSRVSVVRGYWTSADRWRWSGRGGRRSRRVPIRRAEVRTPRAAGPRISVTVRPHPPTGPSVDSGSDSVDAGQRLRAAEVVAGRTLPILDREVGDRCGHLAVQVSVAGSPESAAATNRCASASEPATVARWSWPSYSVLVAEMTAGRPDGPAGPDDQGGDRVGPRPPEMAPASPNKPLATGFPGSSARPGR